MTRHLPRGLPRRQAQFLCLLAARPSLARALGLGRDRRYSLGPAAVITSATGAPNDPVNDSQLPRASGPFQDTFPANIEPMSIPRPRP